MSRRAIVAAAIACRALALGACRAAAPADPGPALQIVGEATALRDGEPVPATSPWFDGAVVHLAAARGETLGIQVLHRGGGPARLTVTGAAVRAFAVERARVAHPSTELYGGSRGAGDYPDGLREAADGAPTTDPAYFEITVDAAAPPGTLAGELRVGERRIAVELAVSPVVLPPLPVEGVWAYADPRELAFAGLPGSSVDAPSASERACIALFRRYGVLLSPDLPITAWPARRELLAGAPDIPAIIPDDPAAAPAAVRAWIAATAGTHQVPFVIPIDEPRDAAAFARVHALATAVRAAGGGPGALRYAVTAAPRAELAAAPIDLYLAGNAPHLAGDPVARWTYNGHPPEAGAMVVDAAEPGTRTWGWIAWRYQIPTWYVWDALYWHDRHNRHGAPLPGPALDAARSAVSFDDGEDHGNLDGVLALPGDAAAPCRPTLRLAALRRGLEDRALLDAAHACAAAATDALAAQLIPRALGDAHGDAAWPASDAAFERARRELLRIAARCARP